MCIKDWKAEFYGPISRVKKADALAHSLKKWEGLTKKNLGKHGLETHCGSLVKSGDSPYGKPLFEVNSDTCALCRIHELDDGDYAVHECEKCPLYALRSCAMPSV